MDNLDFRKLGLSVSDAAALYRMLPGIKWPSDAAEEIEQQEALCADLQGEAAAAYMASLRKVTDLQQSSDIVLDNLR